MSLPPTRFKRFYVHTFNHWTSSRGRLFPRTRLQLQHTQANSTFEDLGIRAPIVAALRAAFTHIQYPTDTQAKFIPAVLSGKDLLLKDDTGTGKSFGLVLALLSKPRLRFQDDETIEKSKIPSITSLVIVPHRDLAYQFLHWVHRLLGSNVGNSSAPLSSIAQVLSRGNSPPISTRISEIRTNPPHILFGTPQALLDVYNEDHDALQLRTLSTVVVDEVDYLIESVPRKPSKKMMEMARKKIDRHPSPTRQLLDLIYSDRIKARNLAWNEEEGASWTDQHVHLPQLIMSSATLRNHLKIYMFNESGWLRRDELQKVTGTKKQATYGDALISAEDMQTRKPDGLGTIIEHCALLIGKDGTIENISDAVPSRDEAVTSKEGGGPTISPESIFATADSDEPLPIDSRLVEKFANTPSPFNPDCMEAVATTFALDVPSIALLVLPPAASVQRAVYELRGLGVNAHGLDLLADDRGRQHLLRGANEVQENPTLLVSTAATTRGLDMPELTHVFILGIPDGPSFDGRTVDSYLHLAGRVGRFGRRGKVISILEKTVDTSGEEGREMKTMRRIMDELKVVPTRVEHFD